MKASLFETATSLRALESAWEKARANGGCAGGDGVSLVAYAEGLAARLIGLSRALRAGDYRPGPLRRAAIPKRSGGERVLTIPSVTDRIAQGAMAAALNPVLDPLFSEASFAYRPGRSVDQAVARVTALRRQGFDWVAEGDVQRCFDRIAHDPLLEALEAAIPAAEPDRAALLDLVGLWLEDWAEDFGTPGRGLAQGSPLAPLLANLALDRADDALEATGARLVRFGDDFVILCRDREGAEAALSDMREALEPVGLTLNEEKTRIADLDRGLRFLGRLFVRSLVLKEAREEPEEADEILRLLARRDDDAAESAAAVEAAAERDRRAGLDAGSRALHVETPGRRLEVDDGSLVVVGELEGVRVEFLRLAPARVDRVELSPGCGADAETMAELAELGLLVHLLDARGMVRATLAPPLPSRGALHLAQARAALEPEAGAPFARAFVEGRMRNQRALLRKFNRGRKLSPVAEAAAKIGRLIRALPRAADAPAAMALEAQAGALYHPALRALCAPGWATGDRRSRRPAEAPLDAALNYLSALLSREVEHAVRRAGLHPGFGALHVARDHGEACVFDLIEEFRAPLAEGPALQLFNAGLLREEDFAAAPGGGVRLSAAARGRAIRAFRQRLSAEFANPFTGRRTSWGGMILHQARALAKAHLGEGPYRAHAVDH